MLSRAHARLAARVPTSFARRSSVPGLKPARLAAWLPNSAVLASSTPPLRPFAAEAAAAAPAAGAAASTGPAAEAAAKTYRPRAQLAVGILREKGEDKRVAMTPENVKMLLSKGFGSVVVESGAGSKAGYSDAMYVEAGATVGDAYAADIVAGIGAPNPKSLRKGTATISMVRPGSNKELVKAFQDAGVASLALDCVPRISRAQVSPGAPPAPAPRGSGPTSAPSAPGSQPGPRLPWPCGFGFATAGESRVAATVAAAVGCRSMPLKRNSQARPLRPRGERPAKAQSGLLAGARPTPARERASEREGRQGRNDGSGSAPVAARRRQSPAPPSVSPRPFARPPRPCCPSLAGL